MSKQNVLIVHCHDLGQYLHCYGKKTVRSPNLDAFAARGVRFANSHCVAPQCSPARASLFTGRYPHNNGVMGLTQPPFGWRLNEDELHLGQILLRAGYRTASVGVTHEVHGNRERCGYQESFPQNMAQEAADTACAVLPELAACDKPFFLSVGFVEPHKLPYHNVEGWLPRDHSYPGEHLEPDDALGVEIPPYIHDSAGSRQEIAGLQGAVKHIDEQFGRIMSKVDALGLRENTVVIFTTDHGVALPHAKASLYNAGTNVALIAQAPAKAWRQGTVHKELISHIDVLPSILELLGLPVPDAVQGRSFVPLVEGGSYDKNDALFTELTYHRYYDPMRAIRTERYKLIAFFSSAPAFMEPGQRRRPLTDPWYAPTKGGIGLHEDVELFDLEQDPWEMNNIGQDVTHCR